MNKKFTDPSHLNYLAALIGFTVLYYMFGKLGLSFAVAHTSASAVWFSTGISLAVILLGGYRFWSGVFIGAFLVNFTTAGNVFTSLGIATGNTVEALLGVFLMNQFTGGIRTFNKAYDVVKFSILVGIFSTMVSATIGVLSLAVGGFTNWANFGDMWLTWWLGDVSSVLVVAPLIILWSLNRYTMPNWKKLLEGITMAAIFFITGQVIFNDWLFIQNEEYSLKFIFFPFLMWAAFRFSQKETAFLTLMLSVIAVLGTLHGSGPFASVESPNAALVFLQIFLGFYAATALILSSVISEREQARKQLKQNQENLSDFVENATEGLHWVGPDGRILWANDAQLEMLGYSRGEYVGHSIFEFNVDRSVMEDIFKRLLADEKVMNQEVCMRCKNGTIKYALINSSVRWEEGKFIHSRCFIRDITDRKMAEIQMKKMKDRLEVEKERVEQVLSLEEGLNTIMDVNKLIDFIVSNTADVLEAQKCSLMLFDEATDELCIKGYKGIHEEAVGSRRIKLGEPIAGIIAQEGKAVLVQNIDEDIRFKGKVNSAGYKTQYKTKSFMCAPIEINHTLKGVMCVADKNNDSGENSFTKLDFKIFRMIVRQVAVALENSQLYRKLNYLATTDPLTGLHNFRHFTTSLDNEIHRVRRYEDPLTLLMIDVDNFKIINDRFGHLEGDALLRRIARILRKTTRKVDIVCRYAGDEFAVILPQTDMEQAKKVAEKIKNTVEEMSFDGKKETSVSIGLAQYYKHMSRYDFILKTDTALLEAKKQGKNRLYSLV